MGTIADLRKKVEDLGRLFPGTIIDAVRDGEGLVREMIQEQLMAGIKEDGRPLTPGYLEDPYFDETTKTRAAAKAKAAWYKAYKERITPPMYTERLFFSPRDSNTPNLIIRGDYHASITPKVMGEGESAKIVTRSIGFYAGDDALEGKYGKGHLGMAAESRMYLLDDKVYPAIAKLLRNLGFK